MTLQPVNRRFCLLVAAITMMILAVSWATPVRAELPPRPTATLPPLPTSTPSQPASEPPAGTIILHTDPIQDGLWSVVQWQDADGEWQDVAGWRGWVNRGETVWWVEAGHWGEGPYRWAVYAGQDASMLAASESFTLPNSGDTLAISVTFLQE